MVFRLFALHNKVCGVTNGAAGGSSIYIMLLDATRVNAMRFATMCGFDYCILTKQK